MAESYLDFIKMTTKDTPDLAQSEVLQQNMARLEELTQRFVTVIQNKKKVNPALNGPSPELMAKATAKYWQKMMDNPVKLMEQQVEYWGKSFNHFLEVQQAFANGPSQPAQTSAQGDRRFRNPMWDTNPYFSFLKQQYLQNAEIMQQAVADLDDLDPVEHKRLSFFTQQIIDMMSPTNFLASNPDALERAAETQGQSLIDGLQNLISDLEANDGELVVRLVDENAFEVGENIATAPGKVVYRNRMMELIQYTPTTKTVHETPIVMFPPWINKFYILDLRQENSLIRWIVDQGYTLFVVSWVNPDHDYADVGLEDYIQDGYLTAVDIAKKICDQDQVNTIGYCIAGTTLSLTLSLMKKRGDASIKSATLFTALTDFSDQGEFTPFLQDDFIDAIDAEIDAKGILESFIMARTFSFLRSNDLVYGPAIKSYMMGEAPPAFDLLYWNGDGSSLPGKMAKQYLRGLCQANQFAQGSFELMGETLSLSDVDVPICAVTCETDHIAAWKDCYRGVQQMKSRSKTFIMSQSGHIAGIVNPPSKKKYGHYTNSNLKTDPKTWAENAEFHSGSWWPRWQDWVKPRSGKQIPARIPGDQQYPALCDAPGTYVLRKSSV
jgi:polyhydroxyalkanoate synthase